MRTGIKINNPENLPEEIVEKAIDMMEKEENRTVTEISIRTAPENGPDTYGITPVFAPVQFQRIRRITGYLVGDLERFNSSKRAEVGDRVTHNVCSTCDE